MKIKPPQLPTDTKALQEMVLALQSQMKTLEQKYQYLIEQFRLAQHQRFGRSSEAHPGQADLFNEAEIEHDIDDADKACDCCGEAMHRMGEERRASAQT